MNEEERLLEELKKNRESIKEVIPEIRTLKEKVQRNIENNDYRSKYATDEKIKLLTSLYNIELDYRKQIESSIKTELEIMRKMSKEEKIITEENIRELLENIS